MRQLQSLVVTVKDYRDYNPFLTIKSAIMVFWPDNLVHPSCVWFLSDLSSVILHYIRVKIVLSVTMSIFTRHLNLQRFIDSFF